MSWVTNSTVWVTLLPDAQQHLLHQGAGLAGERAERFIHQQDLGVVGERSGECPPLTHAARELLGVGVLEAPEADLPDEEPDGSRAARPRACA
jgi:hypothetical protein